MFRFVFFFNLTIFTEFIQNITSLKDTLRFPSEEDLSGAAAALVRLQDTYKLDTIEVAKGKLNGVKYRYI